MEKKKNLMSKFVYIMVQYISYTHGSCIFFTYKILCSRDPFNTKKVVGGVGKMKWVLDFNLCV